MVVVLGIVVVVTGIVVVVTGIVVVVVSIVKVILSCATLPAESLPYICRVYVPSAKFRITDESHVVLVLSTPSIKYQYETTPVPERSTVI